MVRSWWNASHESGYANLARKYLISHTILSSFKMKEIGLRNNLFKNQTLQKLYWKYRLENLILIFINDLISLATRSTSVLRQQHKLVVRNGCMETVCEKFVLGCCVCVYLEAVKFHFRFISFRFITLVSLMIFRPPAVLWLLPPFYPC